MKRTYSSFEAIDDDENFQLLPKQTDKTKIGAKFSCLRLFFSKTTFRRVVRILYLIAIIFTVLITPLLYINSKLKQKDFTSTDLSISIVQSYCKLYIIEDSSIEFNSILFEIETSGEISANAGSSTMMVTNDNEFIDGCWIRMKISDSTIFSTFDYTCNDECIIIHQGPSDLKVSGALTISGKEVNANFQSISADSVDIQVRKGDILIHNGIVSSESYIGSNDGDVLFQSTSDFILHFIVDSNNICFSAPYYSNFVGIEGCDLNIAANNENSQTDDCRGSYILCQSEGCSSGPEIHMYSYNGNVYANLISGVGKAAAGSIVKGTSYGDLSFDSVLDHSLDNIQPIYNDTSTADSIIVLDLGNIKAKASSSMRLLATKKEAYFNTKPWNIAFFSAALLISRIHFASGKLSPGFCPYVTLPTIEGVGEASSLFLNKLAKGDEEQLYNNYIALAYGSDYPQITDTNPDNLGFRESEYSLSLYKFEEEKNYYVKNEYKMGNSPVLLGAIIVGICLAVILGILATFAFIIALNQAFNYFANESEHIRNYVKRINKNELANIQERFAIGTADVTPEESLLDKSDFLKGMSLRGKDKKKEAKKRKIQENIIIKTIKRLPSQFSLIDHFIFLLRRSMTNSVEEFLSILFKKARFDDMEENSHSIAYSQVKIRYEKYCFLKNYTERNILDQKYQKTFQRHGFHMESRMDNTTEVIKKIRFLNEREKLLARSDFIDSDKTSLEFFIEQECVTTQFDEDMVYMDEFKAKYHEFCNEKRLQSIVITRALILNSFGLETFKKELTFLVRNPLAKYSKHDIYNLNIEELDNVIRQLILANVERKKRKTQQKKADPWTSGWYIYDLIAVLMHFICVGVLMCPFIVFAFYLEMERAVYRIEDYKDVISYYDFTKTPWNLFYKIRLFDWQSWVFIGFSLLYVFISLMDLLVYYLSLSFPLDTLKIFRKVKTESGKKVIFGVVTRIFLFLEWVYIFFAIGGLFFYVSLIGVWAVLGAILNPSAYLPYAAGAMTILTFINVKIIQLKELKKVGLEIVMEVNMQKFKTVTDDIMKKILNKAGLTAELDREGAEDFLSNTEKLREKSIAFISQTPEGKKLDSAGFEVETVVRMTTGDENAIIEFSRKKGIPPFIMKAIVAIVKDDFESLTDALTEIASHPAFNVPPEIVKILTALLYKPSEEGINSLIGELSMSFFEMIILQMQTDKESQQYLKLCRQIFPQVITAVRELRNGEIDNFIDVLMLLNNSIIDTVRKKVNLESYFAGNKSFKNLFQKDGEPKFALPKYFVSLIEIMKIMMSSQGSISINFNRLKGALYGILNRTLLVPLNILDFISISFATRREKMYAAFNSKELLLKMDQKNIMMDYAGYLGISPSYVRLLFKGVFEDASFDKDLVTELNNILNDIGVTNSINEKYGIFQFYRRYDDEEVEQNNGLIDTHMIRASFLIYALFKSKNIKNQLLKSASEFGIDGENAIALVNLSNRFECSANVLNALSGTQILNIISKQLRITKQEVSGIISLFLGDVSSDTVDMFLKSFCERNNLPIGLVLVLKSLLTILTSKDSEALLIATTYLKIKDATWILLGKGLIHPRYIEDSQFMSLGIPKEHQLLTSRHYLDEDNYESYDYWMMTLKRFLFMGSTEEDDTEIKLTALALPKATKKNKKAMELIKTQKLEEKKAQTAFLRTRRKICEKLLNISEIQLSKTLLNELLMELTTSSRFPLRLTSQQELIILQFLSVKDIILRKSKINMNLATKNVASLMKFDPKIIKQLVEITSAENADEVKQALKNMLKKKEISAEETPNSLAQFGKIIAEEYALIPIMKEGAQFLSKMLKIPNFIPIKLLIPSLRSTYKLTVDDIAHLFDLAGFHVGNILPDQCEIKDELGKEMTLGEVRHVLTGLAVGHVSDFKTTLAMLGLNDSLENLITIVTTVRPRVMIKKMIKILEPIFTQKGTGFNIPKEIYDIFMALIVMMKGFNEEFTFQYGDDILPTIKFLSKRLGIMEDFFGCLSAFIQKDETQLAEKLTSIFGNAKVIGKELIDPPLVKGILSLASGKNFSIEDIAERMCVNEDLLETCLLFSTFSFHEAKIGKNLEVLKRMPAFSRMCRALKMNHHDLLDLLKLSFNRIDYSEINSFINSLKLNEQIDINFLKALISFSKGYNSIKIFEREEITQHHPLRAEISNDIAKYGKLLFKSIYLDEDLALLAIRLNQGDFYIIEDKSQYLMPLLPSPEVRKLAMGMCGVCTNPIKFKNKLFHYPKEFKYSISFEGAVEMISDALQINPIVARLSAFDLETFDIIQAKYHFPREILLAYVINIANYPVGTSFLYGERDVQRGGKNLYYKLLRRRHELIQAKKRSESMEKSQEIQEIEQNSEFTEEDMNQAFQYSEENNVFDQIDFDSDKYKNLDYNDISLDVEDESIELFFFNHFDYFCLNYDELLSPKKRTRNFKLSYEVAKNILGDRYTWDKNVAHFLYGPNAEQDLELWTYDEHRHKVLKPLFRNWLDDETRDKTTNLWKALKELFSKISNDKEITGDHNYVKLYNSQFTFYSFLLGTRYLIRSPEWEPTPYKFSTFMFYVDAMLGYMEYLSFIGSKLGMHFDRMRVIKMLSLALNVKISNHFETNLCPSFYSRPFTHFFKEKYDTVEEIDKTLKYLRDLPENLLKYKVINYETWHNHKEAHDYQNDEYDVVIYNDANSYDKAQVSKWRPNYFFKYVPFKDNIFQREDDFPISLKQILMVMPTSLGDVSDLKDIEVFSGQPYYLAINVMEKFERYLIADDAAITFVLDLACNKIDILDTVKKGLKKINIIKNESSISIYKSLYSLFCLKKTMSDYLEAKDNPKKNIQEFPLPNLKNLLSSISSNIQVDTAIVEDLIMLAHKNIDQVYFKNLANRYGMQQNIIGTFFISAYPKEKIWNRKFLLKITNPLCNRLEISHSILFAIIDIYYGGVKGWELVAEQLATKKGNWSSYEVLKKFLNMIDWEQVTQAGNGEIKEIYSVLQPGYISDFLSILELLYSHPAVKKPNRIPALKENPILFSIMQFISFSFDQNLEKVFKHLDKLAKLFGLEEEESRKMMEAVCLFLNNSNVKVKKEKILKSIDVLTKRVVSLFSFYGTPPVDFRNKVFGMLQATFAAIYWDFDLFKEGVEMFNEKLRLVLVILQNMKIMKKFSFDDLLMIIKSGTSVSSKILNSFILLIKLLIDLFEDLKDYKAMITKKNKERKEASDETKEVSKEENEIGKKMNENKSYPHVIGRTYDTIADDTANFLQKYGIIDKAQLAISFSEMEMTISKLKNESIPSEQVQSFEIGLNAILSFFGLENQDGLKARLLLGLILGDFDIVSDLLMEVVPGAKEALEPLVDLYHVMKMKTSEFENEVTNGYDNYFEKMKKIIRPVGVCLSKSLNETLQKPESEVVKNFYKKVIEIIDNNQLFPQLLILLHSIKFSSITQGYMFKSIQAVISSVMSIAGKAYIDQFKNILFAMTGIELDNIMSSGHVPIEERAELMLSSLMDLYFPTLKGSFSLIYSLYKLTFDLQKCSANTGEIAHKIEEFADQLGNVFGLNPQEISGIIGMVHGDFDSLVRMVAPITKINPKTVKKIMNVLKTTTRSISDLKRKVDSPHEFVSDVVREKWNEMIKKVNEGTAGLKEIFELLDNEGDKSGGISQEEFKSFLVKLSLNATDHRIAEIFAKCKKKDNSDPDELDLEEFSMAVEYIQRKSANDALNILGLSTHQLVMIFIVLSIILLLLFIFIFLGISAFAMGGSFGAVVNSLLPISAGTVLTRTSPINIEELKAQIKNAVAEVSAIMGGEE